MRQEYALTFGPFRLDPNQNTLWRGDTPITLRARALAVLRYLAEHPDRIITLEEFIEHVWDGRHVSRSVLRVCIHDIRTALGDTAERPEYLETVGRQGYRFCIRPLVRGTPNGDAAPEIGSRPVVGRQRELDRLQQALSRARQGQRQLVWVSGEPGIGKTAVVDTFVHTLEAVPGIRVGRGHCIEHRGAGEAFLPLFEALSRLGRGPEGESVTTVLRRLAPSALVHLPALVPEAEQEQLRHQVEGTSRAGLLRQLAEALEMLAAVRPMVWVLEDLHWSDPSTIDFLAYLAKRRDPAQLLVLSTYRPSEAQGHPLMGLLQEMQGHGQGVELRLSALTPEDLSTYILDRLGGAVNPSVTALLHERSGGNPLFLMHLVEHLVHTGLLIPEANEWTLLDEVGAYRVLPKGIRQLLAKQFEQLPVASQRALEVASVVGERFATAAVAAGAQQEVATIDTACAEVAHASWLLEADQLVAWPDGTATGEYCFSHALVREVIYERLAAGQRMALHLLIGRRLEVSYGARSPEIAAALAVHFLHGQDPFKAVRYLYLAAENASNRSAHREAIAH
ncbi:ATP-binding protein [Candidatus Entotheonella palauensis]|uniref:ATP-binding protein n=1 Tax=Candidatus Entotheonella palauensis TaxID=93172 RepID=UPI000B7F5539|nr:AAA family ATPase [Candidatus Entotheonella palauensis]